MKKYIIISASVLAAAIVIVGGIFTYNALKPKELILKAPKEVSVVLRKGFSSKGATVKKTLTETKDDYLPSLRKIDSRKLQLPCFGK